MPFTLETAAKIAPVLRLLNAILALSVGFIPTLEQVRKLSILVLHDGVEFYGMTAKAWYELLRIGNNVFNLLYPKSLRARDHIFHDGKRRAAKVVENMLRLGKRKLVLIDGHGRLLWHIFGEMIRRGLDPDDYEVYVVDICGVATAWHLAFFPLNVVSVESDICLYAFPEGAYVYFNFCSVNRELAIKLRQLPQIREGHFMISFTERNATDELVAFRSWLAKHTGMNSVISRGHFYTFIVNDIPRSSR